MSLFSKSKASPDPTTASPRDLIQQVDSIEADLLTPLVDRFVLIDRRVHALTVQCMALQSIRDNIVTQIETLEHPATSVDRKKFAAAYRRADTYADIESAGVHLNAALRAVDSWLVIETFIPKSAAAGGKP